jgi:hypothetical protein
LDKGDLHGSYGCWNFESVLGITIEDEELGSGLVGKRFSQLLNNPGAGRMLREVEMQDTPAFVADDKEAVEGAEGDRGHREIALGKTWKRGNQR